MLLKKMSLHTGQQFRLAQIALEISTWSLWQPYNHSAKNGCLLHLYTLHKGKPSHSEKFPESFDTLQKTYPAHQGVSATSDKRRSRVERQVTAQDQMTSRGWVKLAGNKCAHCAELARLGAVTTTTTTTGSAGKGENSRSLIMFDFSRKPKSPRQHIK